MKYFKLYTNTSFTGQYPVPTAAVVMAENKTKAAELLNEALRERGLEGDAEPEDMNLFTGPVEILSDGNY